MRARRGPATRRSRPRQDLGTARRNGRDERSRTRAEVSRPQSEGMPRPCCQGFPSRPESEHPANRPRRSVPSAYPLRPHHPFRQRRHWRNLECLANRRCRRSCRRGRRCQLAPPSHCRRHRPAHPRHRDSFPSTLDLQARHFRRYQRLRCRRCPPCRLSPPRWDNSCHLDCRTARPWPWHLATCDRLHPCPPPEMSASRPARGRRRPRFRTRNSRHAPRPCPERTPARDPAPHP
jgi:hypothetical protein